MRRASIGLGRAVIALLLLGLASCASVGPRTIPRDQFDYGEAIANSWKEQLLTNMIRLRYVEAPVFVNVSSVINQYALEGEVALGAGASTSFTGENTATIGGAGRFSDKPTITYTPVEGREFSISLLTPITPAMSVKIPTNHISPRTPKNRLFIFKNSFSALWWPKACRSSGAIR